ncbi:hypothetical protein [Aneurinibacillus uraniidurans]|uniref:hypothetical protein n=1 Tax=Aneurinibacillus uraniidurans TaxID=2966586 RepID=UPI002349EF66|nr:hypothetical protein [Aneurinibacillus sp. B1]WCN38742.1 hypothetical protein PO771_04880 [Aneurinibacillus sp. B1]
MSEKKLRIWTLFLIVVFLIALYTTSDGRKDRPVWKELRTSLTTDNVKHVSIQYLSDQTITLSHEEQQAVIAILQDASFSGSNREHFGSTPDGAISFELQQGHVSFSFCARGPDDVGSQFETAPSHIDPESQFYIRSGDLARFIENRLSTKSNEGTVK